MSDHRETLENIARFYLAGEKINRADMCFLAMAKETGQAEDGEYSPDNDTVVDELRAVVELARRTLYGSTDYPKRKATK